VKKGALTAEQAETKFAEWLSAKDSKIEGKKDSLTKSKDELRQAALAAESKKKADRAAALAAKNAPVEEPAEEEVATEEAPAAEAEETPAVEETPAAEESNEEKEA
jgi:small subunit ribosomal protein S16